MGLVISRQRVADDRPARLNRDAFFANGATVDHGDHLHEFAISGEEAIVRNLQRQEDGEIVVTTSEQTMSLDAAFAQYEFLLNAANVTAESMREDLFRLAFMMALAEAMEDDAELSDEDRHEAQAAQDSDVAQGSDVDEPAEDDEEESNTASPTM